LYSLPSFPLLRLSGWSDLLAVIRVERALSKKLDRSYPLYGHNPAILTQGLLGMYPMDPDWSIPSMVDKNPLI